MARRKTIDLSQWTTAELKEALRRTKVEPERYDEAQDEASGQPRVANTLFLVGPLTQQIMGYQAALHRIWNRGLAKLEAIAEESGKAAKATQEEQTRDVVDLMTKGFLAEAVGRFRKAFDTGSRFAQQFTGQDYLPEQTVAGMIEQERRRNEQFVTTSLMADLVTKVNAVAADQTLSGTDAGQAVSEYGEGQLSRVGMYALKLWGLGHLGFGSQMNESGKLIDWVVTSENPCKDCPRLQRSGPYSKAKPLPTYPGIGDTECRTNCLCMLREHGAGGKRVGAGRR